MNPDIERTTVYLKVERWFVYDSEDDWPCGLYLHPDLRWRASMAGDDGEITGYFETRKQAEAAIKAARPATLKIAKREHAKHGPVPK